MHKRLLLITGIALIYLLPLQVFSQPESNKGYQYIMSVNTGLKRKMYANEIMFDDNEKYLIVNYGNRPTYIVVFEFGLWQPVANFRLPNWAEFTGAYLDDGDNLYIKISRYSSDYYKLSIKDKKQYELPCETLPRGCKVVEPKQAEKTIYSKDKYYMIDINKKNARDVRIYRKR